MKRLTSGAIGLTSLAIFLTAQGARGQETVRFSLSTLPPGQVRGDQFAALGVHFFTTGSAQALTVPAPAILSDSGETVGRSLAFFIRFDRPITSIGLNVALLETVQAAFSAQYRIEPVSTPGPGWGGAFSPNEWTTATAPFTRDQNISAILIRGLYGSPESFSHDLYFNNFEVTFIPEPSVTSLLVAGLFVMLSLQCAMWRRASTEANA